MTNFRALLSDLRRPRLLIRAARHGLQDYRRERDLRRLVGTSLTPQSTVLTLIDQESRLEETRLRGDGTYSVAHHVEVLIALMAEVRLASREAGLA